LLTWRSQLLFKKQGRYVKSCEIHGLSTLMKCALLKFCGMGISKPSKTYKIQDFELQCSSTDGVLRRNFALREEAVVDMLIDQINQGLARRTAVILQARRPSALLSNQLCVSTSLESSQHSCSRVTIDILEKLLIRPKHQDFVEQTEGDVILEFSSILQEPPEDV
jgi:hypothetical protein